MSLHIELRDALEQRLAHRLREPIRQTQDALMLPLANGITLTVRYAAPDAYSMRWTTPAGDMGIDTAPFHRGLATFPNHLHRPDGTAVADPLTAPDRLPAENLQRVVEALVADPMLGST